MARPADRAAGRAVRAAGRQTHRRVLKTDTPLDAAVSLYHQGANIDRAQLRRLVGLPEPDRPPAPRPGLHDWLVEWIDDDPAPAESLDSLPGVMWHLAGAWRRRAEPNVVLVHYDELQHDLAGAMRGVADRLGIEIEEPAWPALVRAASFSEMSARAESLLPDRNGVLKDPAAFFGRGTSGAAGEVLSDVEMARYDERVLGACARRSRRLAPPNVSAGAAAAIMPPVPARSHGGHVRTAQPEGGGST